MRNRTVGEAGPISVCGGCSSGLDIIDRRTPSCKYSSKSGGAVTCSAKFYRFRNPRQYPGLGLLPKLARLVSLDRNTVSPKAPDNRRIPRPRPCAEAVHSVCRFLDFYSSGHVGHFLLD